MLLSYNNDLKAHLRGSSKSCLECAQKLFIGVFDCAEHDPAIHFALSPSLPVVTAYDEKLCENAFI